MTPAAQHLRPGGEILGFKFVRPDLTTPKGGRALQYLPGRTVRSDDRVQASNPTGCPVHAGDGLCVAHTISGAQSGGLPAQVLVFVAYRPRDVLGREGGGSKVRVRQLRVLDVFDVHRWIRRHGAGADLQGADLRGARLQYARLQYARLQGARLQGADLQGARLQYADLRGADLQGADLQGADLRGADLQGADLQGADLRGAVQYARLQGADLPAGWTVNPSGKAVQK